MSHEPIQFGPRPASGTNRDADSTPPEHLDVDRERGLTVTWSDGTTRFFDTALLRRHSPSAEAAAEAEAADANPLHVLRSAPTSDTLRITDAELVGRYAIRLAFSDGHRTGLFSWDYLRTLGGRRVESSSPAAGEPDGVPAD